MKSTDRAVFQLVSRENGIRSMPAYVTPKDFCEKLKLCDSIKDDYVLVLVDESTGDLSISKFPLVTVSTFISLFDMTIEDGKNG